MMCFIRLTRLEESLKELAQKKEDYHGGYNSNSSTYKMASIAESKILIRLAQEYYEVDY